MMNIIKLWERQSDHKVKTLEIDGGTEYLDRASTEFYESLGIEVITNIRYTPQMNGSAERLVRTLTHLANACLMGSGLSDEFWADACKYVTFIHNRLPLDGETPKYKLFQRPALKIDKFPRFGADCISHLKSNVNNKSKKFTPRGTKGKFIGWSNDRTMRILIEEPDDWKIVESRTVQFITADKSITRASTVLSETNLRYSNEDDPELEQNDQVSIDSEDDPELEQNDQVSIDSEDDPELEQNDQVSIYSEDDPELEQNDQVSKDSRVTHPMQENDDSILDEKDIEGSTSESDTVSTSSSQDEDQDEDQDEERSNQRQGKRTLDEEDKIP
jgi:hypothetical protein